MNVNILSDGEKRGRHYNNNKKRKWRGYLMQWLSWEPHTVWSRHWWDLLHIGGGTQLPRNWFEHGAWVQGSIYFAEKDHEVEEFPSWWSWFYFNGENRKCISWHTSELCRCPPTFSHGPHTHLSLPRNSVTSITLTQRAFTSVFNFYTCWLFPVFIRSPPIRIEKTSQNTGTEYPLSIF